MAVIRRNRAMQDRPHSMHVIVPFVCLLILIVLVVPVTAKVLTYSEKTSTGSLQALINSAENGDTVLLVEGIYPENIRINRPLTLGARNPKALPLIAPGAGIAAIVLTADGITVKDIGIAGGARVGILVQSENNLISGTEISGLDRGMSLRSAGNNIITGNTIKNNKIGIETDAGSHGNVIYLNYFDNAIDVVTRSGDNTWNSASGQYMYNGQVFSGSVGNFWKRFTGSDGNNDGIYDTVLQFGVAGTENAADNFVADGAPLVRSFEFYSLLQQPAITPAVTRQTPSRGGGTSPATQQDTGLSRLPPLLLRFWWFFLPLLAAAAVIAFLFFRKRQKIPAGSRKPRPAAPQSGNATLVDPYGEDGNDEPESKKPVRLPGLPPPLDEKYPGAEFTGEGGIARVFRWHDAVRGRAVAVKVPIRFDEVTGRHFIKDITLWQGLHHKNIVEIYSANILPVPYVEMEYISSSVADLHFPVEEHRAIEIILGIAKGLAYAHDKGVVHRDIKPGNILIDQDGVPKITDWGLAKEITDAKKTGIISFSLGYAAPEQLAPTLYGDPGPWTDIYQIGVMMYEMLTGMTPFPGEGLGEVSHAILHKKPPEPAWTGSHQDGLREIILKCLEKNPQDRYGTVAKLLDALALSGFDEKSAL